MDDLEEAWGEWSIAPVYVITGLVSCWKCKNRFRACIIYDSSGGGRFVLKPKEFPTEATQLLSEHYPQFRLSPRDEYYENFCTSCSSINRISFLSDVDSVFFPCYENLNKFSYQKEKLPITTRCKLDGDACFNQHNDIFAAADLIKR